MPLNISVIIGQGLASGGSCPNVFCCCKAHAIAVVWQTVEVPDPDHEFYRWNSPKMRLFTEMAGASEWVVLLIHWHDAFNLQSTQRKCRSSFERQMQLHITVLELWTKDNLCFLKASEYPLKEFYLESLFLNNSFSQLNYILS